MLNSKLKHRRQQLKKKRLVFGASQQSFWPFLFCQGFSEDIIFEEECNYLRKRESISSMNIMQGDNFAAKVKTAVANFCDSPYHLSVICETSKLINLAPASFAVAFAIIVLPHPGGPCNSTPLGALVNFE